MAKTHKPVKKKAMPYLTAFLLCEKVLFETDNVASAIRIVDSVSVAAEETPAVGQGILLRGLDFLVVAKAGDARGKWDFTLHLITPEPVEHPIATWPVRFAGPPESGQSLRIAPVSVVWAGEGLYYFELFVEGSRLARVPLRINLTRAAPATEEHPARQ